MKLLRAVGPRPPMHQGGWDEILLIVGPAVVLFVVMRVVAAWRDRKEAQHGEE